MSQLPQNSTCWFEIPVTDIRKSMSFYGSVVGAELSYEDGPPNPMAMFPMASQSGVGGHLYPGNPSAAGTGPTIHLVVDNVDAAMGRVKDAGGQVVSPVISIPAGRFAYCLDLDGNSFGVFSA